MHQKMNFAILICIFSQHMVTMKSAVDDIEYGTPNDEFAIDLIQLNNVHMLTLTDICPLYA